MSLKFVNFHGHTGFSLYDGYAAPEDYYEFCLKNAGEDSMALAFTDHGHINAAGYIAALQKKIKDKSVPFKLIWGLEAYYIPSIDEWTFLKAK